MNNPLRSSPLHHNTCMYFRLVHISGCQIILDSLVLVQFAQEKLLTTRQSEMANTSPHHMPVLGNVHPIKIENFDIFSWRHFSARSSFYIINWYAYPRGSHEKYLKEIVSPVFWDTPFKCYMLNVVHVINDVKWRPIVTTFGTLIENMSRTGLYDCHIF